ncbi:MAG: DUF4878 domain-containing protein [Blastocatellia bacterium]|nr:DUF4878 domain-containing protein [Blastocatellia bacterium]
MIRRSFLSYLSLSLLVIAVVFSNGCAAEASRSDASARLSSTESSGLNSTIEISANSPADTVKAFYERLRDRKIRDAIVLTNLKAAVEDIADDELKEFSADFDAIAALVPAEIEINGEIITGDRAVVTAKLPDEDQQLQIQEVHLRKEGSGWTILSVDEEAEELVKRQGKDYFRTLKIETAHEEAKRMLERFAKAQVVYSMQNRGLFGETRILIELGLLPEDALSTESTGYSYAMALSADKRKYVASAIPAEYGKTGKNSYIVESPEKGMPVVRGEDNGGKPLK